MFELQCFESCRFGQVRIVNRDGNPWFVAKDIAECIEHKDTSAMCKMCKDRDLVVIDRYEFSDELSENLETGGSPNLTLVSESGLYRILAKCRLPKCDAFEEWVFDEVIPSIRRTGSYSIDIPQTLEDALELAAKKIRAEKEALAALKAEQEAHIETKLALAEEVVCHRHDYAVANGGKGGMTKNRNFYRSQCQSKDIVIDSLKEQVGDSTNWKKVRAIKWLKDYFELSQGLYVAVAERLRRICAEIGIERREIQDTEYGTVKIYPVKAIDILKARVEADKSMLWKYRKNVNV